MLKLLTLVIALLSLVTQTQAGEFDNMGKFCWGQCKKAGKCNYCGTKGYCCRRRTPDKANGCYKWMGKMWAFACAPETTVGSNGILNENKACWKQCRGKDGKCEFCGTGLCCRKGRRAGVCNGNIGGNGGHTCVKNSVAAPAPVPVGKFANMGKQCWGQCGKPGPCRWCGSEGFCCRSNTAAKDGNGCTKGMGGPWVYQCSKKLTPAPVLPWPKEPWKIPCPAYNDIPRAPLQQGVSYKKLVCDMLKIVNNARANWKPKLNPYCMNSKLMRAARIESYACAKCGKMNHIPWNVGCRQYLPAFGGHAKRIQRCGYKYGGGVAEILAGGPTAQIAYNMWYREYTSSGKTNNHYGAIVNPDRSQVGIAAEGIDGGTGRLIWTIVTARPRKFGEKEKCDMVGWCSQPGEGWPASTAAQRTAAKVPAAHGGGNTEDEDDTETAESQEIGEAIESTLGAEAPWPAVP